MLMYRYMLSPKIPMNSQDSQLWYLDTFLHDLVHHTKFKFHLQNLDPQIGT